MLVKHAFKQILIATREHWDRLETRPAVRDNFLRMIACGTTALRLLTRSHTPGCPPFSCKELTDIALKLRERVDLSPQQRYRLIGVGLSNFREPEDTAGQPDLFH